MQNNNKNPHLAFVFPGQGSQSIGMLSALATAYPIIKETFEHAADTLNFNLWKLVQHGSTDELNQTHHTQAAMLVPGFAVWRLWCQQS
jgi:[acyl-carrier-protein] S-malonyltransferase